MNFSRYVPALVLLPALVVFSGCGKKKIAASRPPANPRPANVRPPKVGDTEIGVASWYGHPYHGRPAADGEIYDMEKFTAAHRTLPFNTWVRVENPATGKSVEVRIIDRGPFVGNRIIDLSRAAAERIEMIGPGTARVRIVVIAPPPAVGADTFAVQVGIFRSKESADRFQAELKARYGAARSVPRPGVPPAWRVLVGEEPSAEQAAALAARIRGDISLPDAFVVRLDAR